MNIWKKKDLIEIRKRYRQYFHFINDILNFIPKFIPEGELSVDRQNKIYYPSAILALFSKSYKTLRAIRLLCMKGLSSDANALLRPLSECLINMLYLSEGDKESKGLEYFQFCQIQKGKILNSFKNNARLSDMVTNDMEIEVKNQSNELRNKMGEIEFNRRYKASHWSGESIEAIAKKVGLDVMYDLTFRLSSQAIHATDYSDHMEYNKGFKINILPGDKWCREVLGASIIIFILILKKINEVFLLSQDEAIDSFEQQFEQIIK